MRCEDTARLSSDPSKLATREGGPPTGCTAAALRRRCLSWCPLLSLLQLRRPPPPAQWMSVQRGVSVSVRRPAPTRTASITHRLSDTHIIGPTILRRHHYHHQWMAITLHLGGTPFSPSLCPSSLPPLSPASSLCR